MTNPTELPNVIELASQLVRLPSVNPMGRGLPPDVVGEGRVTDWLEQHFGRLKVPAHRYKVRQKTRPTRGSSCEKTFWLGSMALRRSKRVGRLSC